MTSARVVEVGPEADLASSIDLAAARAWFIGQGADAEGLRFDPLGVVRMPELGQYRALGGLDRHPFNSQALVEAALDRLDPAARRRVASPLIVVVPPGFRPHCWHLPGGVRRLAFAILPSDATLGAIVHELGHLLFDWPDLERDSGLGNECLMARGALLPEPAPPCAVLRLRAGWIAARSPERSMRVDALAIGEAVKIGERVIERRRGPDRLLVLLDRPRPILLRRIELRGEDLERPLLAVARFG
ncbi:hypothetical protein ACNOYE_28335 [Nannocystaceae bacterium ST9]